MGRRAEITVMRAHRGTGSLLTRPRVPGVDAWMMPIVDLRSGAVVGAEALARRDGSASFLTRLSPTQVRSVDETVLTQALAAAAQWPAPVFVSVNVAPTSLLDGAGWIVDALEYGGICPSRVHLELTESTEHATTHARVLQAEMKRAVDAGARWWLDDFGTGFTSLVMLQDLPISGVKLDRRFLRDVTAAGGLAHDRAVGLAAGMADLARRLGLGTVAEGIECAYQADALWAAGWRYGQGFGFSPARPVLDLTV